MENQAAENVMVLNLIILKFRQTTASRLHRLSEAIRHSALTALEL
jgi:hypothetical protein